MAVDGAIERRLTGIINLDDRIKAMSSAGRLPSSTLGRPMHCT